MLGGEAGWEGRWRDDDSGRVTKRSTSSITAENSSNGPLTVASSQPSKPSPLNRKPPHSLWPLPSSTYESGDYTQNPLTLEPFLVHSFTRSPLIPVLNINPSQLLLFKPKLPPCPTHTHDFLPSRAIPPYNIVRQDSSIGRAAVRYRWAMRGRRIYKRVRGSRRVVVTSCRIVAFH